MNPTPITAQDAIANLRISLEGADRRGERILPWQWALVALALDLAGEDTEPMPEPTEPAEVCGSWRVIEHERGHEAVTLWCARVAGPCPFPGTDASRTVGNRGCAEVRGASDAELADRADD